MYAIRSYYGMKDLLPILEKIAGADELIGDRQPVRITSYNVCYTKLLREPRHARVEADGPGQRPVHHRHAHVHAILRLEGHPRRERRGG